VVGPLPGDLHNVNTYTAAIHAKSARARCRPRFAAQADRSRQCRALDGGWAAAGFPLKY